MMFEKAVRGKFRFPYKGLIGVEELWDLSVTDLDSVYKKLNAEFKEAKEDSLLDVKTVKNTELELKIEIVKHIVTTKIAERVAREDAVKRAEKKKKILEIMADKQDDALKNMSEKELSKLLDEL